MRLQFFSHWVLHFFAIFGMVLFSLTFSACDGGLGDTKGEEGVQGALGEEQPENIEKEFIGVWTYTVMSIQDGEPFEVSMKTAFRIEKALREADVDGDPLKYLIVIDQIEISNTEIVRKEIVRNNLGTEIQEIFSAGFTKDEDKIFINDPDAPTLRVRAMNEKGLNLSFSNRDEDEEFLFFKN